MAEKKRSARKPKPEGEQPTPPELMPDENGDIRTPIITTLPPTPPPVATDPGA